MATFPSYNPVYSATKRSEPRTRSTRFGDGYEQRLLFGLHQNPKEWTLTFSLSDTEADEVEAFLDARAADSQSFDWTPPDSLTSYKWVCSSWTREMFEFQRSKIDVTFREVYEP
jgi:phage-related protein